MTRDEFLTRLADEIAVKVPRRQWSKLGHGFEETECHDTGLAGKLRLGRLGKQLVAVEEASPTHLAVRALSSASAARTFVQERLAAYDRMWDG